MGYYRTQRKHASLTAVPGGLELRCSYNRGLVDELKYLIPAGDRAYNPATKAWTVATEYGDMMVGLCNDYLNIEVEVPAAPFVDAPATNLFKVDYISAAKDRGTGEHSSLGLIDGNWTLVLPESVLRDWFGLNPTKDKPGTAGTLFATLGVQPGATDQDVKRAYRLAARTWHPDKNTDPDAATQFRRINEAYQALKNAATRAKYNAMLKLFKPNQRKYTPKMEAKYGWRPPIRCGLVMVETVPRAGRLVVKKILQWQNITNEHGQILVASWAQGATEPLHEWV